MKLIFENLHNTFRLILSHQAMIYMNADQLLTNSL